MGIRREITTIIFLNISDYRPRILWIPKQSKATRTNLRVSELRNPIFIWLSVKQTVKIYLILKQRNVFKIENAT